MPTSEEFTDFEPQFLDILLFTENHHSHTHLETHAHTRTYTHTCTHTNTHAHTQTLTCTHTHTHMHTHKHTHMHTHKHTHKHTQSYTNNTHMTKEKGALLCRVHRWQKLRKVLRAVGVVCLRHTARAALYDRPSRP